MGGVKSGNADYECVWTDLNPFVRGSVGTLSQLTG